MTHIIIWGGIMILIDEKKIYIKDYQEILYMDQENISIDMKTYILKIKGQHLEMNYYDCYEIRIYGNMKVIEYHDYRV